MITGVDILRIIRESDIDIDTEALDHRRPLHEQQIDSLDMMTILFEVEKRFSVSIAEADIENDLLASIDQIVQYVNARAA